MSLSNLTEAHRALLKKFVQYHIKYDFLAEFHYYLDTPTEFEVISKMINEIEEAL